jgi:hypothetical protein
MSSSIWQIFGGLAGNAYFDICVKYGVSLLGPGDAGPWQPGRDDASFEGDTVRRFATEPQLRDVLLLRSGLSTVCAVGLVASEYQYLPQFDDVNGWDMQHGRRARWFALPQAYTFEGRPFGANAARFGRVSQPEVVDYSQRFINSPPTNWQSAAMPALLVEEPPLSNVPEQLQPIAAQAGDLATLYADSAAFGDLPAEDEMLAHFVVPLLRALGWQPEQIALKWRYVDVAVFRRLPRRPENCHLIIEAKRLGQSNEQALAQAQGYAISLGADCDLVVTDGLRYRLFSRSLGYAPVAYANLARLKSSALTLFERLARP